MIWPRETWVRKTFSNQHIARKWPDPPPKPMCTTLKKASELRFASDTISNCFWDGQSLMGLVDDIATRTINLTSHPNMVLDCVEAPSLQSGGGCRPELYCLNNRRLWCIQRASEIMGQELTVRVKLYRFSDCAGFWQSRITTVNGGCRVALRQLQEGAAGLPPGDMPKRMTMSRSKRKSEYIHLKVDGFRVDVLTSSTPTLKGKQLADCLLSEPRGQRNCWAAVCAAEQNRIKYRPEDARAVKLAKLWAWYVAFPAWDRKLQPRSYLIELIVLHVCQEASRTAWGTFVRFLEVCAGKKIPPMTFECPITTPDERLNWGNGPRIIDPVNPTNNVARPFRSWGLFQKYARLSLKKIKASGIPKRSRFPQARPERWNSWSAWRDDDAPSARWNSWSAWKYEEAPPERRDSWSASYDNDSFEDAPQLAPPNPEEVRKVLLKMGLPQSATQKLLDQGFTSLESLCRLACEDDFLEAGMNKAQSRHLAAALRADGWIFAKLKSEGRLPSNPSPDATSSGERNQPPSDGNLTPIPLTCYPAGSPAAHCLLFGTLVKSSFLYIPVEQLQPFRDFVHSSHGLLQVVEVKRHVREKRWLVQLEAQGARLVVTDSHRIDCVERGWRTEKLAKDLKEGDLVRTSLGDVELSSVNYVYEMADVVELTLEPDEAFEAFHVPMASILSKGQARKDLGGRALGVDYKCISRFNTRWQSTYCFCQAHNSSSATTVQTPADGRSRCQQHFLQELW